MDWQAMIYKLAIDPGDAHVGWASWGTMGDSDRGVIRQGEWDASEAIERVWKRLEEMADRVVSTLILEEFRLYPEKAKEQVYSSMETSQMIGGLKVVAWFHGVEVVEQPAGIKKPTAAQMRARGIPMSVASPHAQDAKLHLVHHLITRGYWRWR